MAIRFSCHKCDHVNEVDDMLAERRTACTNCHERLTVPKSSTVQLVQPKPKRSSQLPGTLSGPPPEGGRAAGRRPRRRSRLKRPSVLAEEEAQLDLTPMIDVTFLLLIFFMVTATYVRERFFELPPPEVQKDESKDPNRTAQLPGRTAVMKERTMLTIVGPPGAERVRVQDEPGIGLDELYDLLAKRLESTGKRDVVIEVDTGILHGALVRTIDVAVGAGAQSICLGVLEEPAPRSETPGPPSGGSPGSRES